MNPAALELIGISFFLNKVESVFFATLLSYFPKPSNHEPDHTLFEKV